MAVAQRLAFTEIPVLNSHENLAATHACHKEYREVIPRAAQDQMDQSRDEALRQQRSNSRWQAKTATRSYHNTFKYSASVPPGVLVKAG